MDRVRSVVINVCVKSLIISGQHSGRAPVSPDCIRFVFVIVQQYEVQHQLLIDT